jgi:hypothetical protein
MAAAAITATQTHASFVMCRFAPFIRGLFDPLLGLGEIQRRLSHSERFLPVPPSNGVERRDDKLDPARGVAESVDLGVEMARE